MKEKKRAVTIHFSEKTLSDITRISEKKKLTKSVVYRMMMDLGVDCYNEMEKAGISDAVDFSYYVKKALRDKLSKSDAKQLTLL